MNTQPYPTDLTDSQWSIIQELIPAAKPGGRPRSLDMRLVINAILYVVVGGIQWRMLPREYPKWYSVYHYFQRWRDDGSWQRIHDTLRAQVRQRAGRHKHPTGGCLDSQSVKTTAVPGNRGFDKAKLINGRKRHILVDTTGLLMAVVVTAGSVQGPAGPGCSWLGWAAPARNCAGSGSTAATAANCLRGSPSAFVSGSKSCCARKNARVSSCYRGAGWWNAPLLGSTCVGASARTMKVSSRPAKR